jgi:hypothetical protein
VSGSGCLCGGKEVQVDLVLRDDIYPFMFGMITHMILKQCTYEYLVPIHS